MLGPPNEVDWPGVTRLPYYPDFLPNFRRKPMSKLVPLPPTLLERDAIWDLLSAFTLFVYSSSSVCGSELICMPGCDDCVTGNCRLFLQSSSGAVAS